MPLKKKIHFEISERKVLLRTFDALTVIIAIYGIGKLFDLDYFNILTTHFYWLLLGLYINLFGTIFEIYNLQTASNQFQIVKNVIITASITVLFYLLTPVLTPFLPKNRLQIIYFYLTVLLVLLLWRIFYQRFIASYRFEKKAILICDAQELESLVLGLQSIDPHYKIIAFLNSNLDENQAFNIDKIKKIQTDELEYFITENSISEIVVATLKTENITIPVFNKLQELLQKGLVIREYSHVYEEITQRIPVQNFDKDFFNYFPFSRSNQNKLYLFLVRFTEIFIAIIGIFVGILLLPIIFLGNIFANRGTLFYTQIRVGKNGILFKIIKFRTMVKNAEQNGAVFSTNNDSRVTPFGNFLRRTRIDEIPQFINILKADMGLIGPRPERPYFVDLLSQKMPFYKTRHIVKPGLTGWAQVNYSYGASEEDSLVKLQYDLYYIKHRSIYLDISIGLKTISTVLFYRGQ